MIDLEVIEQAADVLGLVPDFAGHPAVHSEQAKRLAVAVHGDGDQVAERVVGILRHGRARDRRRLDAGRHALGPQEGVEVAVLAFEAPIERVGVIIVLRVALMVVDVARGVVVPLVEGSLITQDLRDDVVAGTAENAPDLDDLAAGFAHPFHFVARQGGEIDRPGGKRQRRFGFWAHDRSFSRFSRRWKSRDSQDDP